MENNNWRYRDNRERNERDRYRDENDRINPDSYRGAYRLDTTSDHRNVSTWDGYGSTAHQGQRGTDYNRNFNRDYNREYNRNYNQANRQDRQEGYDHDNYNRDSRYRDQDTQYRSSNNADWGEQNRSGSRDHDRYSRKHRSVHNRMKNDDPYGAGNFSADYGPDDYGQGGGANYGNEAGSLSYGYDGTSNYDPDWNSRYDPLSGHRRSYHGNYTSRHPEHGQYRDNASRRPSDHNRGERY